MPTIGIVTFSQTHFTEDLKKITIPVLVMHSEVDQIVPYVAAGPKSAELLAYGILKTYKDFPHGMRPPTRTPSTPTDWSSCSPTHCPDPLLPRPESGIALGGGSCSLGLGRYPGAGVGSIRCGRRPVFRR